MKFIGRIHSYIVRLCVLVAAVFAAGNLVNAGQAVALGWKPSPDHRTSGYVLLYGTSSGEYEFSEDMGNVTEATVTGLISGQTYYFAVYAYGGDSLQSELSNEVAYKPEETGVVSRLTFYNNSAWDGFTPEASALDDEAVAVDKTALLPGDVANFSNYTSYTRGLNGIMVDISAVGGELDSTDFLFKTGNNNAASTWLTAPAPSTIWTRPGAGVGGSTRITLIWPDNAIQNTWLEVTVLATAKTGLQEPDVFYFGNAIGEAGNSTLNASVTSADALLVLNGLKPVAGSITDPLDFNRDKRVTSADALITLNNLAVGPAALHLIEPGATATSTDYAPAERPGVIDSSGMTSSASAQLEIVGVTKIDSSWVQVWFLISGTATGKVSTIWHAQSLDSNTWQLLPAEWITNIGNGICTVRMPVEFAGAQGFFFADPSEVGL
jgi:hypothetical protein